MITGVVVRWCGGGWVLAALIAAGCGGGAPEPVAIDLDRDTCASCRMVISSRATAAEIVRTGDEPRLFDDLACLRDGIKAQAPPPDAVVFVVDHATGEWFRAERAIFTEVPGLQTPMGSGIIAHWDTAARNGDPDARGGRPLDPSQILGRPRP